MIDYEDSRTDFTCAIRMNGPSESADPLGRTALHYAALENEPAKVRELISRGAQPDAADDQGFTPLHLAAQEWAAEAAAELLDAGSTVDATNAFGNTPLFTATFNSQGRGELIQLLREHGADPHHANASGQTPLGLARLIGSFDVYQYFADVEV